MRFTVIIPLYNKAAYIESTLVSVLSQTLGDFEIIVVDDGSTDEGGSIVTRFSDPRIRLVEQANAGVSAARNYGISLASGEWICFLDADDWQHPEYLNCLWQTICAHPDLDIVATRYKPIPDSVNWSPDPWPIAKPVYEIIDDLPMRWLTGAPFYTGSIGVRKELLVTMNPCFPPGESFGEDLDLWIKLAEKSNIALLDQPLIAYRTAVTGSLTSINKHSLVADSVIRLHEYALSLSKESKKRKSLLAFVLHQYITQARADAAQGRRLKSLLILIKFWKQGLRDKRWWTTSLMLLLFPGSIIHKWQKWREDRVFK